MHFITDRRGDVIGFTLSNERVQTFFFWQVEGRVLYAWHATATGSRRRAWRMREGRGGDSSAPFIFPTSSTR
jgi:hypothetical protein